MSKKKRIIESSSIPVIVDHEHAGPILPTRLDQDLDEVGMGAILRRVEDDLQAVVVDVIGDALDGSFGVVVATLSDHYRRGLLVEEHEPELPSKESDYRIGIIRQGEFQSWLQLKRGSDYVLVE